MNECECVNWARADIYPLTNHHPNCPRFNDSLIDVWKVEYEGSSYYSDSEPESMDECEAITTEKMHREVYDNLEEFEGF